MGQAGLNPEFVPFWQYDLELRFNLLMFPISPFVKWG